jgi:Tfp pilus assembly protein PilW
LEWASEQLYNHRLEVERNSVIVMRKRLIKQESGFTLPEVLVTMFIMILVLFALYSIFDMSLRVFSFGNAKVEATDNARLGLEKVAREIRAAFPVNTANATAHPTTSESRRLLNSGGSGPKQITFGNDLNGNRRVDTNEVITYSLSGSGPPYTLLRNSQPAIEYVEDINFTYFARQGSTPITLSGANETNVERVVIELTVRVPPGTRGTMNDATQTLTTTVALRNRGD